MYGVMMKHCNANTHLELNESVYGDDELGQLVSRKYWSKLINEMKKWEPIIEHDVEYSEND